MTLTMILTMIALYPVCFLVNLVLIKLVAKFVSGDVMPSMCVALIVVSTLLMAYVFGLLEFNGLHVYVINAVCVVSAYFYHSRQNKKPTAAH